MIQVDRYRRLIFDVAPPTVLVNMDNCVADVDAGFLIHWGNRSPINRSQHMHVVECVGYDFKLEAEQILHSEGFFAGLPAVSGAVEALQEMSRSGLKVMLVTAPVLQSRFSLQEKHAWIRGHLGAQWLKQLIVTTDKSMVKGDLLIDVMPYDTLTPGGKYTMADWNRVVFAAPYNSGSQGARMVDWSEWPDTVLNLLGKPLDGGEDEEDDEGEEKEQSSSSFRSRKGRSQSNAALHDIMLDVLQVCLPGFALYFYTLVFAVLPRWHH